MPDHAAHPDRLAATTRARKRIALGGGAVVFALFILYPVLTAYTAIFDGTLGGVGVAYVLGFLEVLLALGVALAYARWANRAERG